MADSKRWYSRGWIIVRRVLIILSALIFLFLIVVAALLAWLARQEAPVAFDVEAAKGITFTPMKPLIPGPNIPADLSLMSSNNNVDTVLFGGRYYLAFRTAPTHFASSKTRLIVLSSVDRSQWQKDTEFGMDSDLREPRFLVFNDTLFLYFFQAGAEMLKFEPRHIYAVERQDDGRWTSPRTVYEPGYVAWRIKAFEGTAYMSVYHGDVYKGNQRPSDIRLLTSSDGYDWSALPGPPQMRDVGAEEAEFEFDAEGNLVVVVRQEIQGGSTVCVAPRENLGVWRTRYSPYKYDSSLMFRRGSDFYVIARRNVAGPCDRVTVFPETIQHALNLAAYSLTRKRTTLYKVDTKNMCLVPLFDFPSQGDTAFAGIAPIDAHSYFMVNYSSPLEGWDWPWIFGQLRPTRLYETVLTFP